jgi:chromatin structure-remodeling complex subunit RSC9
MYDAPGLLLTIRMHETFIYSSTSQLLQVTFWHSYRDFFSHAATKAPLLSASEVIKNVTIAFPGASAKIWVDETGAQKFVIGGMGFRKGSGGCR